MSHDVQSLYDRITETFQSNDEEGMKEIVAELSALGDETILATWSLIAGRCKMPDDLPFMTWCHTHLGWVVVEMLRRTNGAPPLTAEELSKPPRVVNTKW